MSDRHIVKIGNDLSWFYIVVREHGSVLEPRMDEDKSGSSTCVLRYRNFSNDIPF